jgi:hypothetical protein
MLLTDKVFQSIFGICILDYSNEAAERREHPRVEFGRRATTFRLRNGKPGPATIVLVRDMSVKGVGLLQSEQMKPLDEFVLDVSKFVGKPLGVRCAVERCEPGGSGGTQWIIGATYEELVESAELLVPAPVPEVTADANPRKRQPILARLQSLLPRVNWSWLAPARRRGAHLAKRLLAR